VKIYESIRERLGRERGEYFMLTAFRVGNFKAFGSTSQEIPLKPITLVFGPNSSGKSTLIHALLLAHEADRLGKLDVFRTEIGGDSVDLGGFRQYVHRRNAASRVEWAAELDTSFLTGRIGELLAPAKVVRVSLTFGIQLEDQGEPVRGAKPRVDSYAVETDEKPLLRASRRSDGTLRLDRLDYENPCFRELFRAVLLSSTTTESLQPEDFEAVGEAINDVLPQIIVQVGNFFPLPQLLDSGQLLLPLSRGQRREGLAGAVRLVLPRTIGEIVGGLTEALKLELGRIRYLGPLRSYPPRHLAADQYHDPNWLAGGGHAYDVVRRDGAVRDAVNLWLGDASKLSTSYELVVRHLVTIDALIPFFELLLNDILERRARPTSDQEEASDEEQILSQAPSHEESVKNLLTFLRGPSAPSISDDQEYEDEIEGILSNLKKLEPTLAQLQLLELVDKRNNTVVTHRDVGIGISQVLPVLVNAYASRNLLLAIEQPEIHLHPALQAELADVFIESALGERKNTLLLETHSEHLILRVLRRIRETSENELPAGCHPIKPDDVAVLYVQPGPSGAELLKIEVREDGEFASPWPNGFFAERAKELF
jgi:hypothetical protein